MPKSERGHLRHIGVDWTFDKKAKEAYAYPQRGRLEHLDKGPTEPQKGEISPDLRPDTPLYGASGAPGAVLGASQGIFRAV